MTEPNGFLNFNTPEDYLVSVYIQQLECEIKYGSGGVKRLYDFRFGEKQ